VVDVSDGPEKDREGSARDMQYASPSSLADVDIITQMDVYALLFHNSRAFGWLCSSFLLEIGITCLSAPLVSRCL
jgi:hypothetical protein